MKNFTLLFLVRIVGNEDETTLHVKEGVGWGWNKKFKNMLTLKN